MICYHLSTVIAESGKVGIVRADHIMEFDLTLFHRLDKACFSKRMPIERRILFDPEPEVIRRYWERHWTSQADPRPERAEHKRGAAFKPEPISFVAVLDNAIPNL